MPLYTDILYRLARFLAGVPPELLGAVVLLALQHPGLVAALFTVLFVTQMVVVKYVGVVIAFVLKYVAGLIIGSLITWYLGALFMLHVWPSLPQGLQDELLKLKDLMLFAWAAQDQASARDEGSERNKERRPRR